MCVVELVELAAVHAQLVSDLMDKRFRTPRMVLAVAIDRKRMWSLTLIFLFSILVSRGFYDGMS